MFSSTTLRLYTEGSDLEEYCTKVPSYGFGDNCGERSEECIYWNGESSNYEDTEQLLIVTKYVNEVIYESYVIGGLVI